MMRFITIFIFCLLIFACSASERLQTNIAKTPTTSPTFSPTIQAKNHVAKNPECIDTKQIIGRTDISFDEKTILNFYEKPEITESPAQTLRFYNDTELKIFSFKPEGTKSYNRLRPEVHKLDYLIFNLAVKSTQSGWLEVIADDQTSETLWLQESKNVKFKDWLEDMKSSFAIGRLNKKDNQIFSKPDSKSEKVIYKGDESFAVAEMKDDWIKINSQNDPTENDKPIVSGWIRWRDKNGCLLIEIFPIA